MRNLNSSWRKLWSDSVPECDSERFTPASEPNVEDILSLANTMGLEVKNKDIHELVEEHSQDLMTDEVLVLHKKQGERGL